MEPKTVKRLAVCVALFEFAPFLGARPQVSPPSSRRIAPPESTDRFIGVWKLNVDKSSHIGTGRELITIEFESGHAKFTYDYRNDSVELNYWFVTDMNGDVVKHTQMDGRPMNSRTRITRLGSVLKPLPPKIPKQVQLVYDRQK